MSKFKPIAAVINAYKARHQPTKPRKNYEHYIAGLASELADLRNKPLSFTFPPDYFQSYVYIYLNPLKPGRYDYLTPSGRLLVFDFEPFYVGKGKGGRAYAHLKEATEPTSKSHKCCTLRKIWAAGEIPIIKVSKSRMSHFMAQAYEIDWIAGVGRRNKKTGPLTNLTDGGEGGSGYVPTQDTRRRLSLGQLNRTDVQKHTEETKAKLRGIKRSEATKAKMSRDRQGRGKGVPKTLEHNKKNTEGQRLYWSTHREEVMAKGRKSGDTRIAQPYIACPHCSLLVKTGSLQQQHFDNCEYKDTKMGTSDMTLIVRKNRQKRAYLTRRTRRLEGTI